MAMKKAEMEDHRSQYQRLMAQANSADRQGLYRKAVQLALASWEHVDGMMQYERRYADKEFASIRAIELVLEHAPLLFDYRSLEVLEGLLKASKRIERDTSHSLADKVAAARAQMWENRRLWQHLQQNPEARQDHLRRALGGDQDHWRSVAEAWERMGLLRRTRAGGSYRLAFTTRLGEIVSGKCASCGEIAEAPKAMFLEELACPACQARVLFVILAPQPVGDNEE